MRGIRTFCGIAAGLRRGKQPACKRSPRHSPKAILSKAAKAARAVIRSKAVRAVIPNRAATRNRAVKAAIRSKAAKAATPNRAATRKNKAIRRTKVRDTLSRDIRSNRSAGGRPYQQDER